ALLSAKKFALEEGLKFVYLGNTALAVAGDTLCPKCREVIVRRSGFGLAENKLVVDAKRHTAKCPSCGAAIYGSW
ncbi:MAG: radical SAM protein, partial [Candidatus Micrarchaeota archaeon]